MVNLNSRELNQHEILALGLNFALTPANIQVTDIIAQVEQGQSKPKPENPNRIKTNVRQILQQSERMQLSNLTKAELTAVKTLRNDDSIIILPADKGNATVVLNTKDYDGKMMSILNEDTHAEVKRNPTNSVERRLGEILRGIR